MTAEKRGFRMTEYPNTYTQARTTMDDGYQHAALLPTHNKLVQLVLSEAEGVPGEATNRIQTRIFLTRDQLIELVGGFNAAIDSMSAQPVTSLGWRYWTLDEIEQDQARVRRERGEG